MKLAFQPGKALFFIIALTIIQNAGAFTLSGTVNFTDINGTISALPGARVWIDDTHSSISDGSGTYSIGGVSGTNTIIVNKSNAFQNTTTNIAIEADTTRDFNLLYSRGQLSTPIIRSGRIITQYSHNFYQISLWRNPDFVWAARRYDSYIGTQSDRWYLTAANYDGENQFSINKETGSGNYQLYFASSDFFNNPTTGWHPTVSETRYFNSSTIYIQQGQVGINASLQHISTAQKEKGIEQDIFGVVLLFMICLIMVVIMQKMAQRKKKKNWNRRRRR